VLVAAGREYASRVTSYLPRAASVLISTMSAIGTPDARGTSLAMLAHDIDALPQLKVTIYGCSTS
jgi:hypothetical protein